MRINSKHYTLIILGIVTLSITSFGYWFSYKTIMDQVINYSLSIQKLEIDKDNVKQEQKLLDIDSATADRRGVLSSYFVSEDKILDFIKSIESIEKDSSAEITLSSIVSEQIASTTGHVKLHVSSSGDWANVNKSLVLIENLPYSIHIDSVSLSMSDAKKWNMSLDISALTMK